MVRLGRTLKVSAVWRVGGAGRNGRQADATPAMSNFRPSAIHTHRDPLDLGGFERVITGNDKHRFRDAFGSRTIVGVPIMCRRDPGNVFVRSGRTDLILLQTHGQSVTLSGGWNQQRVLKTVEERARCF